jgi:hypothetical protein
MLGFLDHSLGAAADTTDVVPRRSASGDQFKRFPGMKVCGQGELVKAFLIPGQAPKGQRVL